MKLLERILIATDLSQAAQDILQTAAFLSGTYRSSIVLLHVVPEIQGSPFSMDMLAYSASLKLRKEVKNIIELGAKSVEMKVLFGSPFDRIIGYADDWGANVIVLGSGEAGGEQKSPLGITAEKVMREASKPVWVVKHGTIPSIKKILCPLDFSDASRRALVNAVQLARSFSAELTVLTVIEPLSYFYSHIPFSEVEDQRSYELRRQDEFDHFLQAQDLSGINWKGLVRAGKPHEQILVTVRETQADLLVMGSLGRTGLSRILMGGVAQRVVREMPCSIITFKSGDASQKSSVGAWESIP